MVRGSSSFFKRGNPAFGSTFLPLAFGPEGKREVGRDFRRFFQTTIHDDISLIRFVIPGLTKPAPYLIRGNPVFLKYWFPAFAGMTAFAMINVAVYKLIQKKKIS